MSARKLSNAWRRVGHCCWSLVALAILAAPSLSWAQCNSVINVSKTPEKNGSGGYTLGETVNLNVLVGGGLVVDPANPLVVSEFRVALDCISADTVPLNNCLGYGIDPVADAAAQDDGDAVEYAGGDIATGNLTVTGAACAGSTFSVNSGGTSGSPAADPNIIVLTASPPISFAAQQTCEIDFDVRLNSYGISPEVGTTQVVNYGAGFKGICTPTLSATPQASDNYLFEVVPDIQIKKYVNVDGNGWEDANAIPYPVGIVPTSTAQYRLVVTNIGNEPLVNVLLNDGVLGLVNVPLPDRCYVDGKFPPVADAPLNECIIESSDTPDFAPLSNPAICATPEDKTNIACTNGVGYFSQVAAGEVCDPATVTCLQPAVDITKVGPSEAKVGDTHKYTICVDNVGDLNLQNCLVTDDRIPAVAASGAFGGIIAPTDVPVCKDFDYTFPDVASPVVNRADVTCDVVGASAKVTDFATWSTPLFVVDGVLTKDCQPDTTIIVPDPIDWDICVENTGDKEMTCDVTDSKAFAGSKQLTVPVGQTVCLPDDLSRPTTAADVGTVTNTANASCTVARPDQAVDNMFDLQPATDTCTVDKPPSDEICRTPGFWGTHAGTEKEGRSTNLTQEVIIYNGGSLGKICGEEITNTSVNGYDGFGSWPGDGNGSAVEGICVHPKQEIVRQLARQLIAASLNCVVSGGDADCTGISIYDDFTAANADCAANAEGLSKWIPIIDAFNNGYDSDCHERNLTESDVFDNVPYKVPGPAGSSNACNAATSNDFYLVP